MNKLKYDDYLLGIRLNVFDITHVPKKFRTDEMYETYLEDTHRGINYKCVPDKYFENKDRIHIFIYKGYNGMAKFYNVPKKVKTKEFYEEIKTVIGIDTKCIPKIYRDAEHYVRSNTPFIKYPKQFQTYENAIKTIAYNLYEFIFLPEKYKDYNMCVEFISRYYYHLYNPLSNRIQIDMYKYFPKEIFNYKTIICALEKNIELYKQNDISRDDIMHNFIGVLVKELSTNKTYGKPNLTELNTIKQLIEEFDKNYNHRFTVMTEPVLSDLIKHENRKIIIKQL